jgi:hypothetical protein
MSAESGSMPTLPEAETLPLSFTRRVRDTLPLAFLTVDTSCPLRVTSAIDRRTGSAGMRSST